MIGSLRAALAMLTMAALLAGSLAANAFERPTRQELEDWFNAPADKSAASVNEGSLVFLPTPPVKKVHHHSNAITITDGSLADGWAQLTQCHENLDQVSAVQIVFNPQRTRNLKLVSHSGVGEARVEDASVQLRNVGPGAKVCLQAEGKALRDNGDGTFSLTSGPFMRRFLDGYYPMHVSMQVKLLSRQIRFLQIDPPSQRGFRVLEQPGEVSFDAWFEGRLKTEIRFITVDGMPGF